MVVIAGVMCSSEQPIDISASLNGSNPAGTVRLMVRFAFSQGRPKTGQSWAAGVGARLSTRMIVVVVMMAVAVL